ncbi:hypothetical protein LR48_Vigan02g098100 [Vigna angularis]|uniref:Uncharacterized protein n=1 Tax=Phaseolus angularis TaxID=3914 RepID=A0A0L9TWF7_PHAAN|nr:hypothetical protein LR48_Vigan02g098100 [Vigna angularis]
MTPLRKPPPHHQQPPCRRTIASGQHPSSTRKHLDRLHHAINGGVSIRSHHAHAAARPPTIKASSPSSVSYAAPQPSIPCAAAKDHHRTATFSFVLTIFLASLQFAPSRSLTLRLMPSSQIAFLPQNNPKSSLNLHCKPLRQSVAAFVLIQTPWTPHLRHQSRTTMEACSFA